MSAPIEEALREVTRIAAMLVRREFTPSGFPEDWPKRPTGRSVARVCEERAERSRLAAIRLSTAQRQLARFVTEVR